jgi:PIN domain nuclease of toxin-antitoxin system
LKLLLDTHIWIWALLDPERLGRRVRRALGDPRNERWLSPVDVWELLVAVRRGRVEVPDVDALVRNVAAHGFHEAPITIEITHMSERLDLATGDPADRLLAATAKTLGLTLVTADRRLLDSPDLQTLPNR